MPGGGPHHPDRDVPDGAEPQPRGDGTAEPAPPAERSWTRPLQDRSEPQQDDPTSSAEPATPDDDATPPYGTPRYGAAFHGGPADQGPYRPGPFPPDRFGPGGSAARDSGPHQQGAAGYPFGTPTAAYGPPPAGMYGPPYPPDAGGGPGSSRRGTVIALVLVGVAVLAALGGGALLLVNRATGVDTSAFQPVRTPVFSYSVPPDWEVGGATGAPPVLDIPFTGVASGPAYTCSGNDYLRGIVASGVTARAGAPGEIAGSVAGELGAIFYSGADEPPSVTVSPPQPTDLDGVAAARAEATIRAPEGDGCLATEGVLIVLAVPLGGAGTAVLIVNGDVAGGPAVPPSPDRATLEAIVGTARLSSI